MIFLIKEACVGSYKEAKRAVELGASRIELCDNLKEGGTTPSYGTIKLAKESLSSNISVIIRPRSGDFIYLGEEIKIMEKDIELCKSLKVDGIVLGVLNKANKIDKINLERLLKNTGNMDVTFHMAFDEIDDKLEVLDYLIDLGIDRVLTKGGKGKALDNMENLRRLVEYSKGRITILAGGGVTKDNYMEIVRKTGVKEVHGSKIVGVLI